MIQLKKIWQHLFLGIASVILLHQFYLTAISLAAKNCYGITEYLINYEGGFVRRGLFGAVLHFLFTNFGVDPYNLIIGISIISFLLLIAFFIINFKKLGFSLMLLPFVFFLGNPILNNFWARKDVLSVLFFIVVIWLVVKKVKYSMVWVNLILILAILNHESFAFFTLPILWLINLNQNKIAGKSSPLLNSFLSILPSVLAFILVSINKGSLEISNKIWQSWNGANIIFPASELQNGAPCAIGALSWDLSRGIDETKRFIFLNFNENIYAPLVWFLIIVVVYFIISNIHHLQNKSPKFRNTFNISNILIFQLISLSPLFILGCDYSRWIFFWVTSSLALMILVSKESLVFPKILTNSTEFVNNKLNLFLKEKNIVLYSFLVGIPGYNWNFENYINTNFIYLILKYISKLLNSPSI